jgi:hypothetical protein
VYLLAEHVTPEDLIVRQLPAQDGWTLVQEVGKLEYVIYEYRVHEDPSDPELFTIDHSGLEFLLARLEELENRCEEMRAAKPTPIELPAWRWNRKRAARRFRRWVRDYSLTALEIPEHIHGLVNRVLADESEVHTEHDVDWWLKKLWEQGEIWELEEYERRKQERPILVATELNDAVRALLSEASEAYFHGLFRATVALFRALLEDAVKQVLRTQGIFPIRPDNIVFFRTLLKSIPSRFWSNEELDIANNEIKDRGDAAMHEGQARFTEDEARRILVLTTRLIQALVNRGGLQDRKAQ